MNEPIDALELLKQIVDDECVTDYDEVKLVSTALLEAAKRLIAKAEGENGPR